ncbi:GNAT family N-acetyltransferase [Planococcus rifietoensis]|uniref:GNAT family N-acetyltransferase n=1 Tax=Planococcus rifietoensis TaxID=200991 RepID=UPI00384DD7F6
MDNNCRFYIVSLDNYNSKDDPADISWVEELFVLEEYRGQSIREFLMEEDERKSEAQTAKLMALVTSIAGNFYKAIGDSESASYFKKNLT